MTLNQLRVVTQREARVDLSIDFWRSVIKAGLNIATGNRKVTAGILHGLTRVVDVDLSGYFDNIRHSIEQKSLSDGQALF